MRDAREVALEVYDAESQQAGAALIEADRRSVLEEAERALWTALEPYTAWTATEVLRRALLGAGRESE